MGDKREIIALYGGGFKPPTKGHFEVAEIALKQNPEIDTLKIFVGVKERDGIDQSESVLVWEIYNNYLPMKVEIIPSKKPPIREIYNYAKENPDQDVYWVIGAREGNEEDFSDIESRSKGIGKYSNLTLKPVVTPDRGISGTNARLALKTRDFNEFEKYLPSKVSKKDKEEIFNILSPSVSESLTEGRYDSISNRISGDIFNYWKSNINNNNIVYNNTYTFEDEDIEIEATLDLIPNSDKFKIDGGAYNEEDSISVEFEVDPEWLPDYWEEISMNLKDVIRHEIEHLTHGDGFQEKPGKYMADDSTLRAMINSDILPKADYFKLEKEIDANLQGMYFRAKKEGKPFRKVIDDYLSYQDLTPEERDEIVDIWSKRTKALSLPPIKETLNENATYSKNIDYKQQIKDLTKHMLDRGMNIQPLPKVIFKHGDQENAQNFFGKTAYYDPNTQTIVLFTEGRHPKDIVRSFAHEMVHHTQNLEGRLEGINTTNTQEDDHLTSIEAEAYKDGNLTFRGYTDTVLNENLNEAKQVGDLYHFTILGPEGGKGIFKILKDEYIKASKISGGISTTRDKNLDVVSKFYNFKLADGDSQWADIDARITLDGDKISNNIKIVPVKDILFAKTKIKPHRKKGKKWFSMDEREELIKTSSLPLIPYVKEIQISDSEYLNVFKLLKKLSNIDKFKHLIKLKIYNSSRNQKKFRILSYGEVENMWDEDKKNIPQIVDDIVTPEYVENYKNMLDKNSTSSAMNYKSHNPKDNKRIQKIISQLNFPLSFSPSLIQGKIDSILKLNEKKNKDPFGLNQYARELAKGLEEEFQKKTLIPEEEVVHSPKEKVMKYTIYSDMDGVITDFDSRFQKFSNGIPASEYESKYGRDKFWDLIDNQIGVRFWVGMDWMKDGKEYWNYINQYNPTLLSAPSINNESRLGKRLWVKKHLPGVPLILAFSKNKKNYAKENAILIDDREKNIKEWVKNGGIGILHTSTVNTIQKLKELGL